jgi:hypothetical protein
MTSRATTLSKIKKLLSMREEKGASPNEAAVALGKARKLASEIGIQLENLTNEELHTYREKRLCTGVYVDARDRLICEILSVHFPVKVFMWGVKGTKCGIAFVGLQEHVELAETYFNYLRSFAEKSWKSKGQPREHRVDWMEGFFTAVHSNLKDEEEEEQASIQAEQKAALMVRHKEDLEKWFEEKFKTKEAAPPKPRPWNQHHADGWRTGQDVNIVKNKRRHLPKEC